MQNSVLRFSRNGHTMLYLEFRGQGALSTITGQAQSANPALLYFWAAASTYLVGPFAPWSSGNLWVVQLAQASVGLFFVSWFHLMSHSPCCHILFLQPCPAQQCFCPQVRLSGSFVPLLPELQNLSLVRVDIMLHLTQCFPAFFADESSHV